MREKFGNLRRCGGQLIVNFLISAGKSGGFGTILRTA